jgi:hypothetical protein
LLNTNENITVRKILTFHELNNDLGLCPLLLLPLSLQQQRDSWLINVVWWQRLGYYTAFDPPCPLLLSFYEKV